MIELNYDLAKNFLAQNSFKDFEIKKIAGDASFRSYYRISLNKQSLILMFAPPSHEDIKPFVKIDYFLRENNFSAPKIIAIDEINGFLLLEDFGDVSLTSHLKSNPQDEIKLYQKACEQLIKLHNLSNTKIKNFKTISYYNNHLLLKEVLLFLDWYLPLIDKKISIKDKSYFKKLWFNQFDKLSKNNHFFILRDFHADNIMLIKKQNQKDFDIGLLDFQDGVIGSNAYDLVSLLEDARRDVDSQTVSYIMNYYIENSPTKSEEFINDYNILSLQRNIKILGIFARLSKRDGKDNYLNLMPRVKNHVKNRLQENQNDFSELKDFFNDFL